MDNIYSQKGWKTEDGKKYNQWIIFYCLLIFLCSSISIMCSSYIKLILSVIMWGTISIYTCANIFPGSSTIFLICLHIDILFLFLGQFCLISLLFEWSKIPWSTICTRFFGVDLLEPKTFSFYKYSCK